MTNVCPQCATENADAAKFCRKCGTPLGATNAVQAPAREEAPAPAVAVPSSASKFEFDVPPTVRCISCGEENDPSARFCKKCGTVLPRAKATAGVAAAVGAPAAAGTAVPVSPQPAPPPFPPAGRGVSGNAIAVAISLAALIAIVGCGAYWWTNRKPPERDPALVTLPAPTPAAPSMAAQPPIAKAPALPPPAPRPTPRPAPAAQPEPSLPQPTPQASPQQPIPQPTPPVAAPSSPSSPREACGRRVFLALASCMAEQCDSPQFRSHSQCVQLREENRRREEAARNPGG